jgi:hypothetical protein
MSLPAPDVEALIQGRTIVALPRIFINPGRQFALYPSDPADNPLPLSPSQYYRPSFLPTARTALAALNSQTATIRAWALCQRCEVLDERESPATLSQLTIWTQSGWEALRKERGNIFLAYLRVYRIDPPIQIPTTSEPRFFSLSKPVSDNTDNPALGDAVFEQRSQQLQRREPPQHPELEALFGEMDALSDVYFAARELKEDVAEFLKWGDVGRTPRLDPDMAWIQKIAETGYSEEGNQFERLVRKSFIKLSFSNDNQNPKASLDPEGTGGPGGLDLYCKHPFPVVGECKASKNENVPNKVTAQLVHLGHTILGKETYERCVKLILAAGRLTTDAEQAAQNNRMNVMRPETLQKLLELKAQHPGAIDLWEFKPCLEQEPFGEDADAKINRYIDGVYESLQQRAHIVRTLKAYLEKAQEDSIGVEQLYSVYIMDPESPSSSHLSKEQLQQQLYQHLIELSSPLAGNLGRIPGDDWKSDRFYFLRYLQVESPSPL